MVFFLCLDDSGPTVPVDSPPDPFPFPPELAMAFDVFCEPEPAAAVPEAGGVTELALL